MGSFTTPTVTRQRGRLVEHTYITAVATLDDNSNVASSAIEIPLGVYAGTVQVKIAGAANLDETQVFVRHGSSTLGGFGENDLYWITHTSGGVATEYIPIQSLFTLAKAATPVNFMNSMVLAFPELTLLVNSDNASADETV